MASTDDLRKRITDPTPLYVVAGAADLAAEKLKEAPALFDKLLAEAPERIAAVRDTDPKAVQERVSQQAQQTQARVSELLSGLDTDIKKLRETAQDLTLQGVGRVAEYAVRARDTYDELAVRGRGAVRTWRGDAADEEPEVEAAPSELSTTRDTRPARTRPTHRIATPPPTTPSGRTAKARAAQQAPAPTGETQTRAGAVSASEAKGVGAAKVNGGANGGPVDGGGARRANGTSVTEAGGSAPAARPAHERPGGERTAPATPPAGDQDATPAAGPTGGSATDQPAPKPAE
ncbi:hypothetical protein [Streptomyces sp. NPDC057702]|uniref:hypothetical protein n=1 Tax=unclassified Streptomyces TaxID=2593676 RepID=UPI0036B8BB3C